MFKFVALLLFAVVQLNANPLPETSSRLHYGDFFQGDIRLNKQQQDMVDGKINSKTGWTYEPYHWIKHGGLVLIPYRIDPNAQYTQAELNLMRSDFDTIERVTCVRFIPHSNEQDYIEIINGSGCWSWLGRMGGRQEVSLERPGCVYVGAPAHEMIHALGYDHMHNSIDRDNYVSVYLQNVDPNYHSAFNKVDPQWFSNFGTSYDLYSVMHYPRWAFSSNGLDTIVPHDPAFIDIIGIGVISAGDAQRINNMYQC